MNEIMLTFYLLAVVLYIIALALFNSGRLSIKQDKSAAVIGDGLITTTFVVGVLHLLYLIWS